MGRLMLNFTGLRPKLYSLDYEREAHFDIDDQGMEIEVSKPTATSETRIIIDNKNAAKGIQNTVAKKLTFENYEHCLRTLLLKQVESKWISRELDPIIIRYLPTAQERSDYLHSIQRGGFAMMVFTPTRLDIGEQSRLPYLWGVARGRVFF